ncbi:hypothetical protein D3C78_881190 [compost metagenome]
MLTFCFKPHAFFVNRHADHRQARFRKRTFGTGVTRIFYPGNIPRLAEKLSAQVHPFKCAFGNHNLAGIAINPTRKRQMTGNRATQRHFARRIAIP